GDDSWTYVTRTDLAVRGNTPPFNHRDTNTLRRIAPPTPNPFVDLLKGSKAGSPGAIAVIQNDVAALPARFERKSAV
ncbi:MAG: hypothetical protein ACXWI6_03520, partial [Burkholderiales bacterium]